MEATVVNYLKAKLGSLTFLQKVYGLADFVERNSPGKERFPAVYDGSELQPVNFDAYQSLVFLIRDGRIRRSEEEDPNVSCSYNITETYPLSIVLYMQGAEAHNYNAQSQAVAMDVARVIKGANKALSALGNYNYAEIRVGGFELDKSANWSRLTNARNELKDTDVLVIIPIEIEVSGNDSCFYGSACSNPEELCQPCTEPGGDTSGAKQGDLLYWDANALVWKRLPAGADGYVLTSNGAEQTPTWEPASCGTDFSCADLEGCETITALQSADDALQANIDSEAQARADADDTLQGNIDAVATDLGSHISDTGNPHHVTLEQARNQNNQLTGNIDANGNQVDNLANPSADQQAATKKYADDVLQDAKDYTDYAVQSNIKIVGDWDAGSGLMPKPDGSNSTFTGVIKQGYAFRVGYNQPGTVGGYYYENGDVVYALIDNPGTTPVDWGDLDHNLQQATESVRGTAKVATAAIAGDETTLDDEAYITGKKLWVNFKSRFLAIAHTFAAKITFTTAPRFSSVSAGQYLKVDSSKDLTSVAAIPATDITEDSTHRFATDTEKATWNAKADKYYTPHNHAVNTYTLAEADCNTLQRMDYATGITVTIPNDTNAPTIQIGYVFRFVQIGAGQITLSADTGVTINNRNGLKTAGQFAVIAIEKTAANMWLCYGDTTT